jgi:hypothetical protein
MALDTRGFMDGALQGFNVMDRYYTNQHSLKQADERMEMDKANNAASLKHYDQQRRESEQSMKLRDAKAAQDSQLFDIEYGKVDENGIRTGGRVAEKDKQESQLTSAQISAQKASMAANQAQTKYNNYKYNQQVRIDFKNTKMPIIMNAWDRFGTSNEVDEILDNPHIKDGELDPRRYLDKKVDQAFRVIGTLMPEVANGNIKPNDPRFADAIGVMWDRNIKAVIGQVDPVTGKTIKDAKYGGVNLVQDIDPNREGDQPGLVVTSLVDYGDGKFIPKPITNNRSTDQSDTVMVIPVETAMKDITSQLRLWRKATTTEAYKKVFGNTKESKEAVAHYQEQAAKIENTRLTSIGKIDSTMGDYDDQVAKINSEASQAKVNLQQLYIGDPKGVGDDGKKDTVSQVPALWSGGDKTKQSFLRAMLKEGIDINSMTKEELDSALRLDQETKKNASADAAINHVNGLPQRQAEPQQQSSQPIYTGDPRRTSGYNLRDVEYPKSLNGNGLSRDGYQGDAKKH